MKTRAIAHGTGVLFYDERGQRTGFNYNAAPKTRGKSNFDRDHSESERRAPARLEPGTLGLAVLPPDFHL
jgi:hypothetical protein